MPKHSQGVILGGLLALSAFGPHSSDLARTSGAAESEERLLRGDWEAAHLFVLVREPLWQDAVEVILRAISPQPTIVLEVGSPWVRDYGPLQIDIAGRSLWLDARYAPGRPTDDSLPRVLGEALSVTVEEFPFRLDGGAVASNGRGLCAMTRSSLQRLAPLNERTAGGLLGCPRLVVIPELDGEPTGHADLVVHFLAADLVAVAALADEPATAANRARLDATADLLRQAALRSRRPLTVVRVPAHFGSDGRFFSYVNLLPTGTELLVPDFSAVPDAVQAEAYDVLRRASGKPLVRVPADAIALAGGGLHCIVLGLYSGDPQPSATAGGGLSRGPPLY